MLRPCGGNRLPFQYPWHSTSSSSSSNLTIHSLTQSATSCVVCRTTEKTFNHFIRFVRTHNNNNNNQSRVDAWLVNAVCNARTCFILLFIRSPDTKVKTITIVAYMKCMRVRKIITHKWDWSSRTAELQHYTFDSSHTHTMQSAHLIMFQLKQWKYVNKRTKMRIVSDVWCQTFRIETKKNRWETSQLYYSGCFLNNSKPGIVVDT